MDDELLRDWGMWKRREDNLDAIVPRPKCTIGRLVKLTRQGGEQWAHNAAGEPLDEELMQRVNETESALDWPLRYVAYAVWVDGGREMPERKLANRLGITRHALRQRRETIMRLTLNQN